MLYLIKRLAILVLLAPFLLLGAFQVDPIRDFLTGTAEDIAGHQGYELELTGLSRGFPFRFTLDHFAVATEDRALDVALDDLSVAWNVFSILDGPLHVDHATIGSLRLNALPAGEPQPSTGLTIPKLPESLLPITVDRVAIDSLRISEQIAGQDVELAIEGSASVDDTSSLAKLAFGAQRIDDLPASLSFDVAVDLAAQTISLDLGGEEKGGWFADLAGIPGIGDSIVSLRGVGPLDDWQGALALDVGNTLTTEGDLQLAFDEGIGASIEAILRPGKVIAEQAPDLVIPETIALDTALSLSQAQKLTIDHARLDFEHGQFDLSGLVDTPSDSIALNGQLDAAALSAFFQDGKSPVEGALSSKISVAGYVSAPMISADVALKDFGAGSLTANALSLTAQISTQTLDEGGTSLSDSVIRITGDAPTLAIDPERQLIWEALSGDVKVSSGPDGLLTISEGKLRLDENVVDISGRFDPAKTSGQGRIALASERLERFSALVPMIQDGLLALSVDATMQDGVVTAEFGGGLSELALGDPMLSGLLSDQLQLDGKVSISDNTQVRIDSLGLQGGHLNATVEGSLDLTSETDSAVQLLVNLSELDDVAFSGGVDASGSATINAQLDGTLEDPRVSVVMQADALNAGGKTFSAINLAMDADSILPSLGATLTGDLAAENIPITLSLKAAQTGQTVSVSEIDISAPSTRISGDVTADLDTGLANGEITGDLGSLRVWQPLAGQNIQGRGQLNVSLSDARAQQDIRLSLDMDDIATDAVRVDTISTALSLDDALGSLQIDGPVRVRGIRLEQGRVDTVDMRLSGNLDALSVSTAANGDIQGTLAFRNELQISSQDDVTTLGLSRLDLDHDLWPISLRQPARATLKSGSVSLSDTQLQFMDAPLRLRLTMAPGNLDGDVSLTGLNLSRLKPMLGTDLDGQLTASLKLQGTPDRPRINLSSRLSELRHAKIDAVPDGELVLDGQYSGGSLNGRVLLNGLSPEPFQINFETPATLSLEPLVTEVSERDLSGRVLGEFDLAVLNDWLTLDGQKVEGKIRANLGMSGSVTQPQFSGSLQLVEGLVELRETGTRLSAIRISLSGQGQRLVVDSFDAATHDGGRLDGTGQVNLSAESGFPFALDVTLDKAGFVRTSIAKDTISGTISLRGDQSKAAVTGDLTVEKLEVQIPDGGGPDIDVIPISESAKQAKQPEIYPIALDVEIRIPERMFVRGRGLESEWFGDLKITGTAGDPLLIGTVEKKRGYLDALDNRFDLRRGILDFDGAKPPVPVIDIEAAAPADDFDAVIALTGRATTPRIRFYGEPDVPEDEVLARLLFGRDIRETTPAQAVRLAAAINKLRGGGSGFDPLSSLRDGLGVDTLDVGGSSVDDASVKAGKYLAEGVFLEVERGIANKSGKARIEIELAPNITLESEVDENSNAGVGLNWRFDY